MPRHLAFLRAINLGAHHKVPMAELRERLTDAGFTDVETHIQTGNIALTSPMYSAAETAVAVEELLREWRGFGVGTMVRSPAEFCALVDVGASSNASLPLRSPCATSRSCVPSPKNGAPHD